MPRKAPMAPLRSVAPTAAPRDPSTAISALSTWLPEPPEGDSSHKQWQEAHAFCCEVIGQWPGGPPPLAVITIIASAGMQLASSRYHFHLSYQVDLGDAKAGAAEKESARLRVEGSRLADASRNSLINAYKLNALHLAALTGKPMSASSIEEGLDEGL